MADTVDIANEQVERFLQLALNRRQRQLCVDCGEPIPLLRQRTIQGCVTCVSCQELWEQRR